MVPDLISILAPSRGRPEALQAMADSAHKTAIDIEILAYVDDDDPADYQTKGVTIIRGPRINLAECWNRLAAVASGDILGMGSDDIRFRTQGWDQMVRGVFAEYSDGIVFVYGRDGIHDEKLGTHGFVSRQWVDILGYFTWGEFTCDYADTWLHDLGVRTARIRYIPDMLIEHLHPIAGKAEWDATHMERRGRSRGMAQLYRRLAGQRRDDAERLVAACS